MDRRDWSQNELARRANITQGAISHVISGRRSPSTEFCTAIARAFRYPPESVFRIAGLLPPDPDPDPESKELLYRYQNAPSNIKEDILEYARYRTRNQE